MTEISVLKQVENDMDQPARRKGTPSVNLIQPFSDIIQMCTSDVSEHIIPPLLSITMTRRINARAFRFNLICGQLEAFQRTLWWWWPVARTFVFLSSFISWIRKVKGCVKVTSNLDEASCMFKMRTSRTQWSFQEVSCGCIGPGVQGLDIETISIAIVYVQKHWRSNTFEDYTLYEYIIMCPR